MSGIVNINTLLKEMKPVLENTNYVFVTLLGNVLNESIIKLNPIATFREEEGITLVLSEEIAKKNNLDYDVILQKITLQVHSSLEAVGLTAAISVALTKANISANVIAGYYHDHVFVPKDKAEHALEVLAALSK